MNDSAHENARIHLDYASATPVAPEVLAAMEPYWSREWANPNALYAAGVRAREVVEDARTRIARLLHVRPEGITFTSGGTEANNLAIIGTVEHLRRAGRAYSDIEIITTRIEHPSVSLTCAALQGRGVTVSYVPVGDDGRIDVRALGGMVSARTALVSIAYVNSEIGVVADVKRITHAVRAANRAHAAHTLVHLDGAQAPLWLPCELDALGVDMLTLDSGKCYGPKGVGVLASRHGVTLAPFMYGGGQEGGLRSGTENVPLIVGCAEALLRAAGGWKARSAAVAALRDHMIDLLLREIPDVVLNGSREYRVANNVNISIPGIDAEFAVITLDRHGINASTKSACGARDSSGSSVVRAITGDESRALSTLRFTLGEETTQDEIERAVLVLREHVEVMRAFQGSMQR